MTISEEARKLRADVMRLGKGTGRKYSVELRSRILSWVDRANASGWQDFRCGEAIDVPQHRFEIWREYARRPADWTPKARESKKPKEVVALMPVIAPTSISIAIGPTVITQTGVRIEGLSIEQIVVLLREFV